MDQEQEDCLQKVVITFADDTLMLVRIVSENPEVPPYYFDNRTKYEIIIR